MFHTNETCQGKDRQERCQGHLRLCFSQRGSALQCPDRRAGRMFGIVPIAGIEERLLTLVKKEQQQQLTLLTTVPGIGLKTALFLIVVTDGFSKFETAAQLCSYVGITPTIRESGSSVRGRSRISKVGNKKLRNLLFLCAFNACKHNKACRDLYERIVNKGKSKKLALIAVANILTPFRFSGIQDFTT